MPSHTIVAVFDTHPHADAAIADLTAAGISQSSIQHYAQDGTAGSTSDPTLTNRKSEGGLWSWLTGEDQDTAHHGLYDHAVESGNTVVTVVTEDHDADLVCSILEKHSPLDIDEHGGEYKQASSTYAAGAATTGAAAVGGAVAAAGEEVVSLSEEALQIGKRVVDAGVTRVRRYTVSRPVEEQVRLRDETVNVFRRPVTGATVGSGAFTDRTIEVHQTSEEAVVGKTAHVVEEVVVQKGAQERVETVRDTIRKEEVEITGPEGKTPGGLHDRPLS